LVWKPLPLAFAPDIFDRLPFRAKFILDHCKGIYGKPKSSGCLQRSGSFLY